MTDSSPRDGEFNSREPIPGYVATELIGRGGCGEVWKAVAPGGLTKAVKIVYGNIDAERAAAELKALARIKDVRHPLLLSIERIELVAGHLVIVTELADCSLSDRFRNCRAANQPGINPDELLVYLSDTADALDFLYGQYSLQHLDVKPENILIVGGRAKIGDFGLIKNLYERTTSLVGGLTPTYSPPEVFEGRPNRRSDQYSLAIVYAHMLTGVLPFDGTTAARLAAQHLRAPPDLSNLPRAERTIVARALSKNPDQRFNGCREFITELKSARASALPGPAGRADAAQPARPDDAASDRPAKGPRSRRRRMPAHEPIVAATSPREAQLPKAEEIPPSPVTAKTRSSEPPAIFVGVGGMGVRVLRRVAERLEERLSDRTIDLPVQFLHFDNELQSPGGRPLARHRTRFVPLRLRPAQAFRSQTGQLLTWLNRRWLYGIPRDLSTGGYRPLGRLALIASAPRVREAIGAAVSEAKAAVAATGNQNSAGSQSSRAPLVYVVGSICGGTGSGALIDLAYALRAELKRQGLPDGNVHGVLLTATPRGSSERDKARANAFAALHELAHFCRAGNSFPGEAALETPPFHGDNATFADVCFLRHGADLDESTYALAIESAAEFLYCRALTANRHQNASQGGPAPPGSDASVSGSAFQSCDILALGALAPEIVTRFAMQAGADVARLFMSGKDLVDEQGTTSVPTLRISAGDSLYAPRCRNLEAAVRKKFDELHLTPRWLLDLANELLMLEAGGARDDYAQRLTDQALGALSEDGSTRSDNLSTARAVIDQALGYGDASAPTDDSDTLADRIAARLTVKIGPQREALLEWLRGMVNDPALRIDGTGRNVAMVRRLLEEMSRSLSACAAQFSKAADEPAGRPPERPAARSGLIGWSLRLKGRQRASEALATYIEFRLNEILHRLAARVVQLVESAVTRLIEQLEGLSGGLSRLARQFESFAAGNLAAAGQARDHAGGTAAFNRLVSERLKGQIDEIALTVAESLGGDLSRDGQGLRRFLDCESDPQFVLYEPLFAATHDAVNCRLAELVRQLTHPHTNDPENDASGILADLIASEMPHFQAGEGPTEIEHALYVPADVEPASLGERLRPVLGSLEVVPAPTSEITLCSVAPCTLEEVATDVTDGVEIYRELARRLHTRVDVAWSSFAGDAPEISELLPEANEIPDDVTPTIVVPRG